MGTNRLVRIMSCIALILLFVTGCSKNESRMPSVNNVDKVIRNQIEEAENENNSETKQDNVIGETEVEEINNVEVVEEEINTSGEVDMDLTVMSSDMIYTTIYQLMEEPDTYIGKKIKINGVYNAIYYEPTDKYYHYVIIEDATACCAQGMEFVWEDGNHTYPDEYPDESVEIEIIGDFETYREEGDDYVYCRLKNSSLRVIK